MKRKDKPRHWAVWQKHACADMNTGVCPVSYKRECMCLMVDVHDESKITRGLYVLDKDDSK